MYTSCLYFYRAMPLLFPHKGKLSYDPSKGMFEGTFSTVCHGKLRRPNFLGFYFGRSSKLVAVKQIKKAQLNIESVDIDQEMSIIEKAGDHPNILRYTYHVMNIDFL